MTVVPIQNNNICLSEQDSGLAKARLVPEDCARSDSHQEQAGSK